MCAGRGAKRGVSWTSDLNHVPTGRLIEHRLTRRERQGVDPPLVILDLQGPVDGRSGGSVGRGQLVTRSVSALGTTVAAKARHKLRAIVVQLY